MTTVIWYIAISGAATCGFLLACILRMANDDASMPPTLPPGRRKRPEPGWHQ